MKPKHQRLIFVTASIVFLCIAVLFTLRAFRDNLVFFYSPSDIAKHPPAAGKNIRIGGLVAIGSIVHDKNDSIHFEITDKKTSLEVDYSGVLPNLFREGQGVVAEGHMTDATHFSATTILAKHDEKYMPKEVVDALKRAGRWQEGQ